MLGRALDESFAPDVRANITLVTAARLTANSAYRFVVPFLAVIARGLDVSVAELGLALTVGELTGLAGSFVGRAVDGAARRVTLVLGLLGLAVGAALAGAAPNIFVFGAALVVIALSKITFDLSLLAWIADHVPLERRGRVIGITETSWAASLFIGVAVLGAITAVWSWRWGYAVAAVAVLGLAVLVFRRLPADAVHHTVRLRVARSRLSRVNVVWITSIGCLLVASQVVFVTLGPWLEDEHGVTSGGIAAVAFGLGLIELVSSMNAVRLTDRWGGRRSVTRGAVLIVPATFILAVGHQHLVIGLLGIGLMVLGFEYAIVSAVSVASGLVPGAPAAGIGMMVTLGTFGRAAGSILGTWLYDQHGVVAPAVLAVVMSAVMVVLSAQHAQHSVSPGISGRT